MKRFLNQTSLSFAIIIGITFYIINSHASHLWLPVLQSLIMAILFISLLSHLFPKLTRIALVLYLFTFATQISSVMLTGNYIDTIALTNLDEYTSISVINRIKILTVVACYTLASFLIKLPLLPLTKRASITISLLFLLTTATALKSTSFPTTSFIKLAYTTSTRYYHHRKTNTIIKEQQKKLYGKDYIVEAPEHHLSTKVPNLKNNNIILFFSEALSAKKIDLFNNYTDLTPNLSAFIKKSLYFDNYYNHTFATFLGLRGQLSSSYQYSRGQSLEKMNKIKIRQKFSTDIITLPNILNQNGYHTYFLSARASSPSNLNAMLNTLGFNHVFTPEDFHYNSDMSDQQLFTQLTDLIIQRRLQEPYFIAIYNIGTHFAEDSPDIKYHDGKNQLLNTIHNFDNAFGKWFNNLSEQPDILNRTAIILTADHAAFSNPEYQQIFEHHPQAWVDKIPLAIYTSHINKKTINANARNSLDLAPTILHMLHINNAKNYFLGCSLFKLYCPLPFNHYSISKNIRYKTTSNGTHYFDENSYPKHIFDRITDFYHLSESYTPSETSK